MWWEGEAQTSAVLGTDSQKISVLISPWVVWNVTDMVMFCVVDVVEESWR